MKMILLIHEAGKQNDSMIILGFVVVAFLLFSNWNSNDESSGGGCSSGYGGGCSSGCSSGCGGGCGS